jgi:hypothetical protein
MRAAGLFDSVAPLLPGCDIGPTIERLPRDAPAPLMLCRDAGSFWAGDVCHRPLFWTDRAFWIDRRFRSPGRPAVPRRDDGAHPMAGGCPNPTSSGSRIVERKPAEISTYEL